MIEASTSNNTERVQQASRKMQELQLAIQKTQEQPPTKDQTFVSWFKAT